MTSLGRPGNAGFLMQPERVRANACARAAGVPRRGNYLAERAKADKQQLVK